MKLLRHGAPGAERPGLLDEQGRVRDLSGHVQDFGGPGVSLDALAKLRGIDTESLPLVPDHVRLGPPLAYVPNFHCIGLNYADHAAETGAARPTEPVLFSKATSSLAGPNDDIQIPPGSLSTDWECELGVVIGAPCWQVDEADALAHVAGYVAVNDLSERDWQKKRGGQFVKGKSAPGFGKIGPWLVTPDDIPDPQDLRLHLRVNDAVRQDASTAQMIFPVAFLISYMSRFMQLQVGDIIATGTPSGVGAGMVPPVFLRKGDVVDLSVQGLGEQVARVV